MTGLHPGRALAMALPAIAALALCSACAGDGQPDEAPPARALPPEAPNLILVVLDTVRADHLGCYGYERGTSPSLDAFASGATLFTRAMAASPWTVPTHASYFTGLYPFEHGARTYANRLPREIVYPLHTNQITLAEILRIEGYRTAAFIANAGYLSPYFQLDQGFDAYVCEALYSDRLNERIFEWLEEHGGERFFLFINYIDAHRVYNTAPRPGLLETPAVQDKGELLSELVKRVLPAEEPVPADLARKVIDQYDTAIANLDEAFGDLLERLRAMDLYDRSLIVATSDHGEYFGEHHLVEHSKDIYQEALWVPLLIKAPGQRAPETVGTLVSSIDMPHQILSQVPEEISGKYMKLFPHAPGEEPVISENYYSRAKDLYNPRWGHRFHRVRRAIFDWPYKYIHSSDGQHELFDLVKDPLESGNLVTLEPEIAARLHRSLEEFMARRLNTVRVMSEHDFPTEERRELIERLRSLGYVE